MNNVSDSQVFCRRTGAGPAVILLHGFPESGEVWSAVQEPLSASFSLIVPDMPGSGGSPLNGNCSIGDMAGMVLSIMDSSGVDKAVIAGHSMGGYIAFEFAARYPSRVAGLSLVHSSPYADDENRKNMRLKAIELIRNGGKAAFINGMTPGLFSPEFRQKHPEVIAAHRDRCLELTGDALINFYEAMIGRRNNESVLDKASFPVQWIAGTDDSIIPAKTTLGLCHRADVNFLSLYAHCGHMSMYESPGLLVSDLRAFAAYAHSVAAD